MLGQGENLRWRKPLACGVLHVGGSCVAVVCVVSICAVSYCVGCGVLCGVDGVGLGRGNGMPSPVMMEGLLDLWFGH
jgi:hypothetical protein